MSNISTTKNNIVGVLLAGGRSSRMGCGEKGLKQLGAKPMIGHVIDSLQPQVGALVINSNADPSLYEQFGLPVIADIYEGHAGPLAGILTGMIWAKENHPAAPWIATAACDTPFFPQDYVAALHKAIDTTDPAISIAASGDRCHYVFGLWPVSLAEDLAAALLDGQRKVQDWIECYTNYTVNFPLVEWAGEMVDPFFNANTPEDFAFAEKLTKGAGE